MRIVVRSLLALALVSIVGLYALTTPLEDFVEYWTASHLLVAGANPYSLRDMFQAQQVLGWPEPVPLMVVSPPWIIPFIAPLGLFKSYAAAWLTWVVFLAALVMLSTRMLLSVYDSGGAVLPAESSISRCLLGFSFYPALVCLKFGQVGPLLLLGVAGFLWFEQRRQPVWAGVSLALTAIKPQLLFVVWIALLLDSLRRRVWKPLVGAVATLAFLTGIAFFLDHRIIIEYWQLTKTPFVKLFPSAVGALLRRIPGAGDMFWLQFAPAFAAVVWLYLHWRRFRDDWHWSEQMPSLVSVTALTTPYGWTFDQTVLVLPIVALAAHYSTCRGSIPRNVIAAYTAVNVALILMLMRSSPLAFPVAPVTILVFLTLTKRSFLQRATTPSLNLSRNV